MMRYIHILPNEEIVFKITVLIFFLNHHINHLISTIGVIVAVLYPTKCMHKTLRDEGDLIVGFISIMEINFK